jgi:dihydroxy-acid dehydratase
MIDALQDLIQLNVPDEKIAQREAARVAPAPRYTRGVMAKFAALTSSASKGAITG